jgi:hypothetical protein
MRFEEKLISSCIEINKKEIVSSYASNKTRSLL